MLSLNLVNITVSVPNGTVTHDDGHVLCVYGGSWRASLYVATFFAANYAAHAATIKSNPGDRTPVTVCNIILALLFPVSGLMRAINAIVRFGRRGGSDVEKACRAGALCMVVRVPGWIPAVGQTVDAALVRQTWTKRHRGGDGEEGERMNDLSITASHQDTVADVKVYRPNFAAEESSRWLYSDAVAGRANVNLAASKVHGSYSLPPGYGFAILPRDTRLIEWTKPSADGSGTWANGNNIASTYSLAKAAISIIQALAAFATLLGHREDVVRRWGYASFHLTILPYLVMTVFNFVSNICTADYDCLYMVETLAMDEARERGGMFEGTVAATYTVTGPRLEDKAPPSSAELYSYNGFDDDNIEALHSRLERLEEIIVEISRALQTTPLALSFSLSMTKSGSRTNWRDELLLWLKPWSKTPTNPVEISCSRVLPAARGTRDLTELHSRSHGSGPEQLDAGSDHHSYMGEGVELDSIVKRWMLKFLRSLCSKLDNASPPHACDRGGLVPPVSRKGTTRASLVWKGNEELSISSFLSIHTTDRSSRRYAGDLETARRHLSKFKALEQELTVNGDAENGLLGSARANTVLFFKICSCWLLYFDSLSLASQVPCAACDQENAQAVTKTTIHFPICYQFVRGEDISSEGDDETRTLRPTIDPGPGGRSRCVVVEGCTSVQKRHRAFGGILAQIAVGLLVNGIILTLIGSQSDWFAVGQASLRHRIIMLLWMCEGILGMFLVMLTLDEVLRAFLLFPLVMFVCGHGLVFAAPLAIFVAPVWGFIIVGQMLVDWGQCVTLYH